RTAGERIDQIDAVLLAVGRGTGRDGPAAVRVNGKAERLGRRLVLAGVVDELVMPRSVGRQPRLLEVPAAEHARRGVEVGPAVVADAPREQLHDLAPEVLLRLRLRV